MNLLSPNRLRVMVLAYYFIIGLYLFIPKALAESPKLRSDALPEAELTTGTFQVINLNTGEIKERIKKLLSPAGRIEDINLDQSGEDLKFLVVTDTRSKIQEISQVVADLEKKYSPTLVNLNFVDVPLNQIFATLSETSGLNIIGGETLADKISVHLKDIPIGDVFPVILRSTPYTYIREGSIIRILSRQELPLATEIFELHFISADQLKDAVSAMLTQRGNLKAVSKFSEGKYANFLVITDIPESLAAVRGLVGKLDKRLRQVSIEAQFCEVTLTKNEELGVDWVIKASLSGATGPTTFPLGTTGQRIIEQPETITGSSGAITLGTMSFADFKATLHALDTNSKVNMIASPQVSARDGEEAQIIIGDKIPIPTYERNSDTGTMEVTGYQIENVGTVLKVTPVINNDNTVTLNIHPEVSEITGYTGPNNERPIVSSREISTVFTIQDGKTIVLGGLRKQTLSNSSARVPFLSKVPILGKIFKYKDDSNTKTELLIFITPRILEDAQSIGDSVKK